MNKIENLKENTKDRKTKEKSDLKEISLSALTS